MNITEATQVTRLLRLLDGSYTGTDVDTLTQDVAALAERAAKPLQVVIDLDTDETRATISHLLQRIADGLPGGVDCPSCDGVGERYWNNTNDPALEQRATCRFCTGSGQVAAHLLEVVGS